MKNLWALGVQTNVKSFPSAQPSFPSQIQAQAMFAFY